MSRAGKVSHTKYSAESVMRGKGGKPTTLVAHGLPGYDNRHPVRRFGGSWLGSAVFDRSW